MTLAEFRDWAITELGFDVDDRSFQTWVETNVRNILSTLQEHHLLGKIQQFIITNQTGSHRKKINITGKDLEVLTKEFNSIKSKLFRMNVLENELFPDPPAEAGWVNADNLYERLNDLARATIICRHIDEPRKISEELQRIGRECGVAVRVKAQAKERGYYAYHVYFGLPVLLVNRDWVESEKIVEFEVQITTQMQYMLYELTHVFYDLARDVPNSDADDWKWDYRSPKFRASYLSHTLHLLEGVIVSLYEDMEQRALPISSIGASPETVAEESR